MKISLTRISLKCNSRSRTRPCARIENRLDLVHSTQDDNNPTRLGKARYSSLPQQVLQESLGRIPSSAPQAIEKQKKWNKTLLCSGEKKKKTPRSRSCPGAFTLLMITWLPSYAIDIHLAAAPEKKKRKTRCLCLDLAAPLRSTTPLTTVPIPRQLAWMFRLSFLSWRLFMFVSANPHSVHVTRRVSRSLVSQEISPESVVSRPCVENVSRCCCARSPSASARYWTLTKAARRTPFHRELAPLGLP